MLPFQQSGSFFFRKDVNWENIAVLLKVVLHLILHRLFVGYSAREWMDGWMFSLVHRLTPWHCLFVCLVQFEYQAYLLGTITLGNGHVLISAPTTISKFHNIMLGLLVPISALVAAYFGLFSARAEFDVHSASVAASQENMCREVAASQLA